MKVYIVTDGHYSDYSIQKVFSNREAAEEYKKWHNCSNEIEVYELFDSMEASDSNEEKAIYMSICGKVYPEAVVDIKYDIQYLTIDKQFAVRSGSQVRCNLRNNFDIAVYRYYSPENWNEEVFKERLTKALYDNAGLAKSMFADGANQDMVNLALIGKMEEDVE